MVVPPALGKSCSPANSPALPHGPAPTDQRQDAPEAAGSWHQRENLQAKALGQTHRDLETNPSGALGCSLSRGEECGGKARGGICLIQPQTVWRWLQRVFEARAGGCAAPLNSPKCFTTPAVRRVFLIFANCHSLCVLLAHEICLSGMKQAPLFFLSPGQAVILTISAHSHCCPVQMSPFSSLSAACKRAQMPARTVPACQGTHHLPCPWGGRYRDLQIWGGFSKEVGLLGKVPVGDSQWLDAG